LDWHKAPTSGAAVELRPVDYWHPKKTVHNYVLVP